MGELTWHERGRLWLRLGLRLGLWGLGALFARWALPGLLDLFGPFLAALGAAWLLNRPIRFLQRRLHLRRGAASVGMVVLSASAVGGMIAGLGYLLVICGKSSMSILGVVFAAFSVMGVVLLKKKQGLAA